MDYSQIYKEWISLPQCKVSIPGERLWGRKLPDGTVGLDNNPLDKRWRYQDIVNVDGVEPKIIHRRWNGKAWFTYKAIDEEAEDEKLRAKIFTKLKPLGDPNFFCKGLGYCLIEVEQDAKEIVKKTLADLDFVTDVMNEDG